MLPNVVITAVCAACTSLTNAGHFEDINDDQSTLGPGSARPLVAGDHSRYVSLARELMDEQLEANAPKHEMNNVRRDRVSMLQRL